MLRSKPMLSIKLKDELDGVQTFYLRMALIDRWEKIKRFYGDYSPTAKDFKNLVNTLGFDEIFESENEGIVKTWDKI